MDDVDDRPLTGGAKRLIKLAVQLGGRDDDQEPGISHWLSALLERHAEMVRRMLVHIDVEALLEQTTSRLRAGEVGGPLDVSTVVERSFELARARGKKKVAERDLATVILTAAGFEPAQEGLMSIPVSTSAGRPDRFDADTDYSPVRTRPTPALDRYGVDLTNEALRGQLSPLIGRQSELELIVETLCRRSKRNPILVGPAGVGKTAIIEGLARRVVEGRVPQLLQSIRIIALQPSGIISGVQSAGAFEKRLDTLIREASQPGIILFIDETHAIVGSGGPAGTADIASRLKPALARGDIACIAATTDDEFRKFIEPDKALERRFQPIRVQELSADETVEILAALGAEFERTSQVHVKSDVFPWLVDFAQQFLRNRCFPDKGVDLLEQSVAYALTQDKKAVELADAQFVAQRMVGMPLDLNARLDALQAQLSNLALLLDDDVEALLERLAVTLRGLDIRPVRPNFVLLLAGAAAANGELIAGAIAETLFGDRGRQVHVDFSRLTSSHDISLLLGSSRGYVGYDDALPLHKLVQMPWCLARFENIHLAHWSIVEVMVQALNDGFFTDNRGKRLYLSDAVVLLTAQVEVNREAKFGFQIGEAAPELDLRAAVAGAVGGELSEQVDLVCFDAPPAETARRSQLEKLLLEQLARRYAQQRMQLVWDRSFVDWLAEQQEAATPLTDLERLLEDRLSPLLIPFLPDYSGKETGALLVTCQQGEIQIVEQESEG